MTRRTRLFLILWLAGMTGVLSLLLVDIPALVANLPLPPDAEIPPFTPLVKVLTVLQPAVLVALAVFAGVALASKVGLSSPAAEALADKRPWGAALRPQLVPGLLGGIAGGVAIVLLGFTSSRVLPAVVVDRIGTLSQVFPFPTRLLYGGIVEELLLRWGLMTLLVWGAWRLFQRGRSGPGPAYVVAAILVSALLFAAGHLPVAFLLMPEPTPAYVAFVIGANSVFSVIAGFLYWKRGLESAVIAHMVTHVVLLVAGYLGVYF